MIAAHYVEKDWSLSFIMPAFFMGLVGFMIFLFVVESPKQVGIQAETAETRSASHTSIQGDSETESLLSANVRVFTDLCFNQKGLKTFL